MRAWGHLGGSVRVFRSLNHNHRIRGEILNLHKNESRTFVLDLSWKISLLGHQEGILGVKSGFWEIETIAIRFTMKLYTRIVVAFLF